MIRSFGIKLVVLLSLIGGTLLAPPEASVLQSRLYATQSLSYTVYYYVRHDDGRVTGPYVYGTYTSWAMP